MPTSHFFTTEEIVWHDSLEGDMLGALSARPAAALLVAPQLRLYALPHGAHAKDDDPALFTEPVFTGYAKQAVTLTGPFNLSADGKGVQVTVTFTCTTSPGVPVPVGGWWLCDDVAGAATRVYAEGDFGEEFLISHAGDAITLTVVLPLEAVQTR
jgi:hypothetical protein